MAEDDLTQALDPTAMKLAVAKAAAQGAARQPIRKAIEQAAERFDPAMMLIRTYRVRGHLAADLDPLGLSQSRPARRPDARMARLRRQGRTARSIVGGTARPRMGHAWASSTSGLREIYCGKVGLEYMHISDIEERRFLQEKFEGPDKTIQFTDEGKRPSSPR